MVGFHDRRDGSHNDIPGDKFNEIIDANYPKCPSCGGFIPNNETPGAYTGALSRKDNKTEICSSCGTKEALVEHLRNGESYAIPCDNCGKVDRGNTPEELRIAMANHYCEEK